MLDWHLFPRWQSFLCTHVEGEGASKVETRLTVDWDEGRLDLSGDLAAPEKETAPFLTPYLWDSSPHFSGQSKSEIAMGEAAIASYCQEDRMFELLKSANLAYDRKNELFAACSERVTTVDEVITHLWRKACANVSLKWIYSSEREGGRLVSSCNFTIFVWWKWFHNHKGEKNGTKMVA